MNKQSCRPTDDSDHKCAAEIIEEAKPLSFLLTKVSGIDYRRYNSSGAVDIKGLFTPVEIIICYVVWALHNYL